MDLTIVGTLLHYLLAVEFLVITVVGLAVCLHALSVDYKIRYFSKIQQETMNGIYDGWKKVHDDKEAARLARMQEALG